MKLNIIRLRRSCFKHNLSYMSRATQQIHADQVRRIHFPSSAFILQNCRKEWTNNANINRSVLCQKVNYLRTKQFFVVVSFSLLCSVCQRKIIHIAFMRKTGFMVWMLRLIVAYFMTLLKQSEVKRSQPYERTNKKEKNKKYLHFK